MEAADPQFSNSLVDLAARIKSEHTAVSSALKESLRHAIAAGELLLEAKDQVPHGQWLPWLQEHCSISERTAQLYMRVAKNRAEIENQIRNDVADLTLNEATALLALSSDVRKLLQFAKEIEGHDPETVIKACLKAGVAVIQTPFYNARRPK
jgi:2-succinyl-5-enolpyruvyl-6-hydroxy-3-cyclohexene-1-carboxylate synthase